MGLDRYATFSGRRRYSFFLILEVHAAKTISQDYEVRFNAETYANALGYGVELAQFLIGRSKYKSKRV